MWGRYQNISWKNKTYETKNMKWRFQIMYVLNDESKSDRLHTLSEEDHTIWYMLDDEPKSVRQYTLLEDDRTIW